MKFKFHQLIFRGFFLFHPDVMGISQYSTVKGMTSSVQPHLSSSSCLKRLSFSFCMFLETLVTFLKKENKLKKHSN